MSFIQNLFTSRDNNAEGNTFVGQQDRIWWNPDTNAFYYSDGNTAGGIPIGSGTGTGIPIGPINSVQLNAGGGNFVGTTDLTFNSGVLSIVGNASVVGNVTANYFLGNGSQLTGVITALGNAFATVNANGTALVADSSSDTVAFTSGNNLVITGTAGTDTMNIAVADAPVFSGNVTTNNTFVANSIASNGTGNVYVTGNLLPSGTGYSLGAPTIPWVDSYFGPQSINILAESGNSDESVGLSNQAGNLILSAGGFVINGPNATAIFQVQALTGQLFSNAQTIIANAINSTSVTSGSLQTAGGAGIGKDLYVGGNIYGSGRQLSNVVNSLTSAAGISLSSNTGNITIGSTGVLGVNGTTNQINVSNVGNILTLSLPQNLNTTANVQLYSLTVNDLTILGNISNVIPSVINGKIVFVANTATNLVGINTSGLVTGNAANGFYAGILYETSSNTWITNTGNSVGITAGDIYTTDFTANGAAHFGAAYLDYDFPDALIQGDINIDSYGQFVLKNHSQTANASSDIVAVANNGNDSGYYIDMGINSNVYANVDYAVTGYNDGYLYVNGGNLVIGTQTPARVINFFTGGTNSMSYVRAVVSDTELTMKNANVLVEDGAENSVIELRSDGNIVFNGSQTLRVNSGFYVSSVSTNAGDANIVNYTGGQFVYGPALKDYAGNLKANIFTASGNITGGNVGTAGVVSATGNITGNYFIGNGSQLTGIVGSYGNANVVANLAALASNPVSTTGNVTAGYLIGNGSQLTGVIHSLGNAFTTISSNGTSITATTSTSSATLTPGNNISIVGNSSTNITVFSVVDAPVFSGNVIGGNIRTGGLITATGNITGNYFIGNGSQLTGVNANWTATSGISQIINKTGATGPTTIALGQNAAGNVQGTGAIAIGVSSAGSATTSQGADAIAIGTNAGGALAQAQGDGTIAIGKNAGGAGFGTDGQQTWSIAIGTEAGTSNQAAYSVALGAYAGRYNQGSYATALGQAAGLQSQGQGAVAIGAAGYESQGQYAVAIGSGAGDTNQGNNAIAIGYQAGTNNQTANSIILNASGSAVDTSGVAGLFISPVRNSLTSNSNPIFFNTSTKELTYANTISLAGNVTGGNILTSGNLSVSGNTTLGNVITAPQITKAANATGTAGQICWDANYIYVCTATNTWKRSPLTGGY